SLLFSAVIMLFSGTIADYKDYTSQEQTYIIMLAAILAIDAIAAIPFAWLRLQNKAIKFASIKLTNIVITVVANLFFLWFCREIYNGAFLQGLRPFVTTVYDPDFGIGYIFAINLAANALLLPLLWREFSIFRFEFNWNVLHPMMVYAYPLMLMGMAGVVNE